MISLLLQQIINKGVVKHMKKGTIILSAAIVIIGGLGLILGNTVIASKVMASDIEGEKLTKITNESLNYSEKPDSSDGQDKEVEDAEKKPPSDLKSIPSDSNLSEEEAFELAMEAFNENYGIDDLDEAKLRYHIRARECVDDYPSKKTILFWSITLYPETPSDYPDTYRFICSINDETLEISVNRLGKYKEGEPKAGDKSEEEISQIGIKAIKENYSLTQETIDRFTVTAKYYEICPDVPNTRVWWVNLYPTITSEYTEIGCYTAYVNAETGEIMKLESAADGKG